MKGPTAKQTEEERALNEVSVAQWNDYVTRYIPAESELLKRAELTAGERASVRGQAATDIATAFKGLTRNTIAAGEQGGADASSGKTKFGLASDADARGAALGMGKVVADLGAEASADKQQTGIVGLGRQVAADTTSDMAQGARRASKVALAHAAAKFERNAALIDASAAVAGAAVRKYQLNKEAKTKSEQSANRKRLNESGLVGAPDFEYQDPWSVDPESFVSRLLGG